MNVPIIPFETARSRISVAGRDRQAAKKKVPVIRYAPPAETDPKPGFEITPDAPSSRQARPNPPASLMAEPVLPDMPASDPVAMEAGQEDDVLLAASVSEPVALDIETRSNALAELVAICAARQGVELLPADLIEQGLSPNLDGLAEALHRLDQPVELLERSKTANPWPALAEMTTGQIVLVLGQDDKEVTIHDPSMPDKSSDVALAEFQAVATGRILRLPAALDQVEARHQLVARRSHWFWGEFQKYRRYIGEIILGSFVANLLAVGVALFALQVYDRVIPHQSQATLWVLAIGAFGALIMEAAIKIARARLMDGAGRQVELAVQRSLMARLLGMRGRSGQTPSTTFSAMREFSAVREFFTASTIGSLADIPFIFVFLLLVGSIAGNLVWVLVLGGILMVLPGIYLRRKMMRLTEETQGAAVKANRLLQEAIYDAETVQSNRAEDRFARIWDELSTLSAVKSSEQRKLAATLTFWSQGVQQATYVAAIVLGTFMVFSGVFTVGTIIAVGILTSRTLAPLTQLAGIMARWSNVKTALTALEQIAEAPQVLDADRVYMRREKLDGRYLLKDIRHSYDADGAPVLDLPKLGVIEGQTVALLGANGSGKSTLLKLMSGLDRPAEGRVLIDGIDLGQLHNRDLRRGVGYLAQEVRLFQGTLRDNLNLSQLERDDTRLMQALEFAGLGPFVAHHPKGLDLPIHDGGVGLSMGQRQSIGWARLWLADPRIVLLDEPTAALDQTLEATMISRLQSWLEGRTAVIATHRMPILSLCDRVIVLQNGRLSVDGPRDEVLSHLRSSRSAQKETA